MAKIGLVTPGLPEKNFTQDVLNNMQKQGMKGAGNVFIGPQNITAPTPKAITAVPIADQYTPPSNMSEKIIGASQVVGNLGKEIFLPTLKNVWGFVTQPFEIINTEAANIQFKNAHDGQDKLTYYNNIGNQLRNDYRAKTNQLTQDLQTGAINKTQYDQQAADLYREYDSQFKSNQDKYNQAKLERYGFRDWQTGQYKENMTIGDLWNGIDAAITLASLGTAGAVRATVMQNVKNGVTKTTGNFLIDSLESIGAKKLAIKLGAVKNIPKATQLANKVDDIVNVAINKNPTFRNYAERQITKLGGDATARKFFTNATAELFWRSPLRNQNMTMAKDIYDSILNDEFMKTPEGKSWLSSGIGQSLLLGSQLLEGGPLYPIYKLVQVGKEFRLAAFGDEAVRAFGELNPDVLKGMTNQEVVNYLTQLSKNEEYGTLLDFFMRGISGTDNALDSYKYLSENKELIPLFKAFVASNVNTPERLQASLAGILRDMDALYTRNGVRWTAKEAFDNLINFARAQEVADQITQRLVATGKLTPGTRGIAITFSRTDQARVVKEISKIMVDIAEQSKTIPGMARNEVLTLQKEAVIKYIAKAQRAGEYWAMHDGMMADLVANINSAKRAFSGKAGKGGSIVNAIKNINTEVAFAGAPRSLVNQMKKLGYIYSSPTKLTNPWYTVAETANTQLQSLVLGEARKGAVKLLGVNNKVARDVASELLGADIAAVRGAQPQFKRIGNMLTAAGLSPVESSKEAYRLVHTNAINHIDDIEIAGRNLPKDGATVLNDLYNYMNDPKGTWFQNQITKSITDLRFMTKNEIAKATGLSGQAAKEVQRAIIQSHIDVPLAIRGLGDKVVDYALKNPLQRVYQRLQGVLRYSWNPFFRVQEISETKTLAAGLSNGMTLFNPKSGKEVQDIVKLMEDYKILDGGRFGEGATNVAMGRLRTDITRFQKNDLARYVDYMAQKMTNGDVEALLRDHTAEVIDNIRPIVQYPTRGILNSNLARAVNLAIFPARYNVKVAALATKVLSQQSPIVQAAVIRGMADMGAWLQTPEGLAWKQDYANEIAMMKWLSPIGNLDWTFKTLLGNFNSWRDVGLVGGLPFGVWTQILTSQGVLPEQPPYVDPKTGTIYSRKVPETMKGRMAMAIMDMLSSVYTYPGRTLMLPSKSQINKDIAYNITGAGRGDISTRTYTPQELSEKSRREQQFWYNRANAPVPVTTDVKQFIDTNIKNPDVTTTLSLPTLQRYTKSQIRKAPSVTKRTTTGRKRRGKIPVPFEELIRQSKAK